MNQKRIGIIVIIIGIVLSGFTLIIKNREDLHINSYIEDKGTCFLPDGTCLHAQRDLTIYFGFLLSAGLIILGLYLIFFDKTQKVLAEHQIKVSNALEEASKRERDNAKFDAFLGGFKEDEKTILKAIKEQDGILQSTLRYRTGMSKTSLSLTLKSLEEREIISRTIHGKTNQVFLRKKF